MEKFAQTADSCSLAQARAFVLAKQGLSGAGLKHVYDATLATAGVYATAPTCYLSYAARVKGFRLADLDEELYRRRRLVRLRCMRGSSYIEPVEALPAIVAATRAGEKAFTRILQALGLTESEFARLADRIEDVLAGHKPVTIPELRALLGTHAPAGQALQYAVALMARQARLVRAEVRGSWTSDNYTYARWADWVGAPIEEVAPETARVELARRYLRAFGPATAADLKWWVGWTTKETTAALDALGDEVTGITLTDPDAPAASPLVLTGELPMLLAANPEDARGVRLLPVWDTYTMGYSDRRRFVTDADYGRVYDRAGNGTSVVLIDGIAAGVWDFDYAAKPSGGSLTIRVAPFGPAAIDRWTEVEDAAAVIAAAIGADELHVERAPQPGRLADGARNAFLAPIRLGRARAFSSSV
jgi:hypothetical protein